MLAYLGMIALWVVLGCRAAAAARKGASMFGLGTLPVVAVTMVLSAYILLTHADPNYPIWWGAMVVFAVVPFVVVILCHGITRENEATDRRVKAEIAASDNALQAMRLRAGVRDARNF